MSKHEGRQVEESLWKHEHKEDIHITRRDLGPLSPHRAAHISDFCFWTKSLLLRNSFDP